MALAGGRGDEQFSSGGVRVSYARGALLGVAYLGCYWLGRGVGGVARAVLWCAAGFVKGFKDAW